MPSLHPQILNALEVMAKLDLKPIEEMYATIPEAAAYTAISGFPTVVDGNAVLRLKPFGMHPDVGQTAGEETEVRDSLLAHRTLPADRRSRRRRQAILSMHFCIALIQINEVEFCFPKWAHARRGEMRLRIV